MQGTVFSDGRRPTAAPWVGYATRLRGLQVRLATAAAVAPSVLFGSRRPHEFGILMYHRIADPTPGLPPPTCNVTPRQFRRQLAGLLARGYQAWPLRRLIAHSAAGRPIPPRTFAVTFDDGYENVYRHAWPILRRLAIPATVFLTTAYLDGDGAFPFDDWPAAGYSGCEPASWRPLTTAQCRQMSADGLIELGTHTHTHGDFRGRPGELFSDLDVSLRTLQARFGVERPALALPWGWKDVGFCDPQMILAAAAAGVRCCLSTSSQTISPGTDPFTWGRFTAQQYDTPATLIAKLNGWYSALKRCATVARLLPKRGRVIASPAAALPAAGA